MQAITLIQLIICLQSCPAPSMPAAPQSASPVTSGSVADFLGKSVSAQKLVRLADDRMFIRRIFLDLTGRLPGPAQVAAFTADTNPDKRENLINALLDSEAFNLRWTKFFEDIFQNRMLFFNPDARNRFQALLKQAVTDGTPLDQMARDILASNGQGERHALFYWAHIQLEGDFRLDNLDDQASFVTETMLGVRTTCISCHDGAYHLEEVNKGLSVMTRNQFWGLAAMLSKSFLFERQNDNYDNVNGFLENLGYVDVDDSDYSREAGYFIAEYRFLDGEYRAQSDSGVGMRPARNGGLIQPQYPFSEDTVREGESRRQALARLITADRQFARNMVNRVWAHLFGEGFVEPHHGWDLGRIDQTTAASFGATVQSRNIDLVEYLSDVLIDSNYNLRALIRSIVGSDIYQWDYHEAPPNSFHPMDYWRGRMRVRRLDAESILDGIYQTLGVPRRYVVYGRPYETVDTTWALPGTDSPTEFALIEYDPENDDYRFAVDPTTLGYNSIEEYFFMQYATNEMLLKLGRGDYLNNVARDDRGGIDKSLSMMNLFSLSYWVEYANVIPLIAGNARALTAGQKTPNQVVNELFGLVLYRAPNEAEAARCLSYIQAQEPEKALADILWALFNHPDFLYK